MDGRLGAERLAPKTVSASFDASGNRGWSASTSYYSAEQPTDGVPGEPGHQRPAVPQVRSHDGAVTQEDPIGIAGRLNTYGYANGDPINVSDPFGLCPASEGALFDCRAQPKSPITPEPLEFAWDGNQILWEVRSGFQDESAFNLTDNYGHVGYTQAFGIDAPVGMVRNGTPIVPLDRADETGLCLPAAARSGVFDLVPGRIASWVPPVYHVNCRCEPGRTAVG